MTKLYYYPGFISLVPHILLEEIGTEYELAFVNLHGNAHKRPEFLSINPNGLVPVLVDGELVLYESAAICLHLVDGHPGKGLAPPQGSVERAHFYKWLMWLATTLHPAVSMYLHPTKWGSSPDTLAELGSSAESKVVGMLDILDGTLEANGGPWLLGTSYSAIDAYALTLCRWTRGMPRPGASWPHFGEHARRVLQRPAVMRAIRQEHLSEPWI